MAYFCAVLHFLHKIVRFCSFTNWSQEFVVFFGFSFLFSESFLEIFKQWYRFQNPLNLPSSLSKRRITEICMEENWKFQRIRGEAKDNPSVMGFWYFLELYSFYLFSFVIKANALLDWPCSSVLVNCCVTLYVFQPFLIFVLMINIFFSVHHIK